MLDHPIIFGPSHEILVQHMLTLVMLNRVCTTFAPQFLLVNLQHFSSKLVFSIKVENSVNPDQMACFIRSQLIWIYSVFKKDKPGLSRTRVNNLHIHSHALNIHSELSSGARYLNFVQSIHLHSYFVCAI